MRLPDSVREVVGARGRSVGPAGDEGAPHPRNPGFGPRAGSPGSSRVEGPTETPTGCESPPSVREPVEQPTRAHDLGARGANAIGQIAVGGDHYRPGARGGDGRDRVVTLAGRVHHVHPVRLTLVGTRPGSPLEHHGHRRFEPSVGHGGTHPFREAAGRALAVAPPAVGPGPDDVRRVDQEHRGSIARRGSPGSLARSWAPRPSRRT